MLLLCTLASRQRLTNSLIFRTAEFRGSSLKSFMRSRSSISNKAALSSYIRGSSQKEPTYTRNTFKKKRQTGGQARSMIVHDEAHMTMLYTRGPWSNKLAYADNASKPLPPFSGEEKTGNNIVRRENHGHGNTTKEGACWMMAVRDCTGYTMQHTHPVSRLTHDGKNRVKVTT